MASNRNNTRFSFCLADFRKHYISPPVAAKEKNSRRLRNDNLKDTA